MQVDESLFLPPSDIRLIDSVQMMAYLRNSGWEEREGAGRGISKVYFRRENRSAEAAIPLSTDVANYDHIVARSINIVSQFEQRPQSEVYDDLLFFVDDKIDIGESSPDTSRGTVSFDRATAMLAGIRKTLLATAHLEIDPQPFYDRQQRVDADRFLSRCRFGQTKRGSYVMTVVCPLSAVPAQPKLDNPTLFEPPFTRRVTYRLMQSLNTIVAAAQAEDISMVSGTNDKTTMLSANLCDAILELAPTIPSGNTSVTIKWAKKSPVESPPEPVVINYDHIPFIEAISSRLRSTVLTELRQTFSGRIDTLDGRAGETGRMEGPVYSRVMDESGETKKVRVDLNAQEYQKAVDAHKGNRLVVIRGILKRTAGAGLRIEEHDGIEIIDK